MKKLTLILDETNWLEATWVNENDEQLHCESYSGHPEHIAMLRAKALEYDTELDEDVVLELVNSYVAPTEAELTAIENATKLAEAKAYLLSTDFKMTVDYYATLTAEEQTELTEKRAEARMFLKEQGL